MKKNRDRIFLWMNILLPVMVGGITYYLISPEVFFVRQLDALLGSGIHIENVGSQGTFFRWFRNYALDMLWGYALFFTLHLMVADDTAEWWKTFGMAAVFSAGMELLQIMPGVAGTFDVWDIVVELLAEGMAALVLLCDKNFPPLRGQRKKMCV